MSHKLVFLKVFGSNQIVIYISHSTGKFQLMN